MFMIFLGQLHILEEADGCVANIISIQLIISDTYALHSTNFCLATNLKLYSVAKIPP